MTKKSLVRVAAVLAVASSGFSAHAGFSVSFGRLEVSPDVRGDAVRAQRLAEEAQLYRTELENTNRTIQAMTEQIERSLAEQAAMQQSVQVAAVTPANLDDQRVVSDADPLPAESASAVQAQRLTSSDHSVTASNASQIVASAVANDAITLNTSNTPAPDAVAVMAPPVEYWHVSPTDGTLRAVMNKWAAKAGWQVSWEASVDMPLPLHAEFVGDFRTAVKELFNSISAAEVNLNALLYTGNRVVRITEVGRRSN